MNVQNKVNKLLFIIVTIFLLVSVSTQVQAADKKDVNENKGLGFTVSPVFNQNQIERNSSLFYVKTTPGEEQTVEVNIRSTQKSPVVIKINMFDAFTSYLGTIQYEAPKKIKNRDETLKNSVSEVVSSEEKEVTVENFEEKTVKIKITPPKDEYQGVKMGAIEFLSDQKEQKGAMQMKGSFQVGVILASSGDQFNDGEKLEMKEVKAQLDRGARLVTANLQNPESKTLENLKIRGTITDKKSGKKIKEREMKGVSMAPNSNFNYEMDWGLAELPAGKFHYSMNVKNDFHEWKFEKDFEISGKLASDINDESAYKILTPSWIKLVSIVQGVVLVIIIILLIVRRKKFEKLFKEKKKKNKKKKSKRGA